MIDDRTNSQINSSSAFITYIVYLDNPDDYLNVAKVRITNPNGIWWEWDTYEVADCWNSSENSFVFWYCYDPDNTPHSILLGEYTAEIFNSSDDSASYTFTVFGRGNIAQDSGYLYSTAAGFTPRILELPTSCSAVRTGDTLDVSFTTGDDSLITNAYVWYFDAGDNYLGWSGWLGDISAVLINAENSYSLDVSAYPGLSYTVIVLYSNNESGGYIAIYRAMSSEITVTSKKSLGIGDIFPDDGNKGETGTAGYQPVQTMNGQGFKESGKF